MQTNEKWQSFSWHCPNCGELTAGYQNASGTIKSECRRCHTVMVRRIMGRRHNRIDVFAPKGEDIGTDEFTSI